MKQNLILYFLIIALIAGGLGFYGGTLYAGSNRSGANGFTNRNGQAGRGGFFTNNGTSVVRGQVAKVDSNSLTVTLRDGSSKVVLLSGATVDKTVAGAVSDITSGVQVMVIGKTNSDGSVSAQTVQLNPQFGGPGGGQNPRPTGTQ